MRAMLNDTNYKVATYNSSGEVSFICPSEIIRNTCASVMAGVTKMSMAEANHLMAREIVDGKEQYNNGKTWTPAHDTFKVHTKVPTWFSPEEYVGPDDK